MALIMIENLFRKGIHASDYSKTLLSHFQDHGIDWMQACGQKCRCTTCKVIVKAGIEHFSPITGPEAKYRQQNLLRPDERLACQARATGDVTILVPSEYKLPHVRYSDES